MLGQAFRRKTTALPEVSLLESHHDLCSGSLEGAGACLAIQPKTVLIRRRAKPMGIASKLSQFASAPAGSPAAGEKTQPKPKMDF